MNYRIIDYPRAVSLAAYTKALDAMTARLLSKGAVAVYQAGGVSNPGISDLDMLAVFKNEIRVEENFLNDLSEEERYLFIHNPYGISESDIGEAQNHAFYYNLKFLAGNDVRKNSPGESAGQPIKIQVALEFLIKFYITLGIQRAYGVLRMRDLLLHVKALQYDLEFIGINDGVLYDRVAKILEWRKAWLEKQPEKSMVLKWTEGFFLSLEGVIDDTLEKHPFFLPPKIKYGISKNISLVPKNGKIRLERSGILLPMQLSGLGKRYFRIQNRFNNFQLELPVQSSHIPEEFAKRFHFERKIVDYNRKYLPNFLPLTSSLHAV